MSPASILVAVRGEMTNPWRFHSGLNSQSQGTKRTYQLGREKRGKTEVRFVSETGGLEKPAKKSGCDLLRQDGC